MNELDQLRLEEIKKHLVVPHKQADANPDMWYEVFVTHDDGSTESVDSGDTFKEAAENLGQHCKAYDSENLSIDIWHNQDNPQPYYNPICKNKKQL